MRTRDEQIDDLRAIINEVGNQLALRPKFSGIYGRTERAAMQAELAEATRELNELERDPNAERMRLALAMPYRRGHEVSRDCPCDRCDAWFRTHGDDEDYD